MEFLKDILGEELFTQVASKLEGNETIKLANLADGQYIPKAKFDAERNSSKALKTQIEELNTRIATMQEESSGVDAIKSQLAQLQKDIATKEAEMRSQRMDFSIIESARKHKAKDPELMARMIDKAKIAEKDDGYIGLDEQFDDLAKTYAYMFDSEIPRAGGFDPSIATSTGVVSENSVMNQMIRGSVGIR